MNALQLVRRLRGKSPQFILMRGIAEINRAVRTPVLRHRLQHLGDERALRAAQASSASSLVRDWSRAGPFAAARERERIVAWYDAHPEQRADLRRRADRALERTVDLLGSGPRTLGDPIPWCSDFVARHDWPLTPSHRLECALLHLPCDVKIPWELSRFQHLFPLGQTWILDRDERAAAEFRAQVESWDAANPVGLGPNWVCTMDVALRACSLLWLAAAFADAPSLDERFWQQLVRMLWQHGAWMPEHLEKGEVNGNHYISDALGLVVVGHFFQASAEGRSWLTLGGDILDSEILLQIEPDGVDIEASVPYQRLVMEIFLVGRDSLVRSGTGVSTGYDERLAAAMHFVAAYVTPEGLVPVVGDADDGRVVLFTGQNIRDHRYLLDIGAAWFGTPRPAYPIREESIWFLDAAALAQRDAAPIVPAHRSTFFPDGGVAVLRSATQYCFVDVGPVGLRGRGGHGHNDALAFEWHAFGVPVITDSGSFVYTSAPDQRNRFRSTEFHAVMRVDGEELNRFFGPLAMWSLHDDARVHDAAFGEDERVAWVGASHRAYDRLPDPVAVTRRIELSKTSCALHVHDTLACDGAHALEWFFPVAPGWQGTAIGEELQLASPDGALHCRITPTGLSGRWTKLEGWFSPSYGVRVERERWCFEARTTGAATHSWLIAAQAANLS